MEFESQFVSLKLSQKLERLGVNRKSHFYWTNQVKEHLGNGREKVTYEPTGSWVLLQGKSEICETVRAYSVAELGGILPEKVVFRNYQKRTGGKWRMNWGDLEISGDTEAEMKANYIIYLLENDLIIL